MFKVQYGQNRCFGAPKPNTLHYIFIFGKLKIACSVSVVFIFSNGKPDMASFFVLIIRLELTCQLPNCQITCLSNL